MEINNIEKYKVKAFPVSQSKWEAQYISPPKVGNMGMIETGDSNRLGKYFETETAANNFTLDYLTKGLKISKKMITVW